MAKKFILVPLSKNISKIRYSKSCILYHITYTTIEALLYQPLRVILTLKSNRSMISFGRKHCKYDMHTYFHASFLGIEFKSFMLFLLCVCYAFVRAYLLLPCDHLIRKG